MVVGAWVFIVQSGMRPENARDGVRMMGDNSSSVVWVNKCRGKREPRSGVLMRMLGCLEVGSGSWFEALHVVVVENTMADGILRWEPESIHHHPFVCPGPMLYGVSKSIPEAPQICILNIVRGATTPSV